MIRSLYEPKELFPNSPWQSKANGAVGFCVPPALSRTTEDLVQPLLQHHQSVTDNKRPLRVLTSSRTGGTTVEARPCPGF